MVPAQRLLWVARILWGFSAARLGKLFFGLPPKQTLPAWNSMFRRDGLPALEKEKRELEAFDLYLWLTMNDPRLLGQIVFEYGTLLNAYPDWKNKRVLDVGTGRSTLPFWMASNGASVVMFEHPQQAEAKTAGKFGRLNRLLIGRTAGRTEETFGDMLSLPFEDGSFDLVTSFSVLEHLDTQLPERTYVPYPEQRRRAAKALEEMARVLRPGGHLYLTSECCDFGRAKTDAWKPSYYFRGEGPALSGAWPVEDVHGIFYGFLEKLGCEPEGPVTFQAINLNRGENFCTYRGQFFSAFSVWARKKK